MLPAAQLTIDAYTTKPDPDCHPVVAWTQLRFGNTVLSNCLEHAVWSADPVLPMVCESCGLAECAASGLARVVRTNSQLVWMPPYLQTSITAPWGELETFRFTSDAAIIPGEGWQQMCDSCRLLPPMTMFPRITSHDLVQLWLQQRPAFALPAEWDTFLHHLQQHVVASHPHETADALAVIARFLRMLEEEPRELSGSFRAINPHCDDCLTLYFDSPTYPEFAAFDARPNPQPIIAGEFLWRPAHAD